MGESASDQDGIFTVMISFGPEGLTWAGHFNNKADALVSYEYVRACISGTLPVELVDHHGNQLFLQEGYIHGVLLEDFNKTLAINSERVYRQHIAQEKMKQKAQSDPHFRMTQSIIPPGPFFAN
jgi:hypothetical protein